MSAHGAAPTARLGASQTGSGVWRLVAAREVTTRIREKSFLVGLGLTVLFLGGFFVVSALFGGPEEYDVAVVDRSSLALVERAGDVLGAESEDSVTAREVTDAATAERLVTSGEVDVALLPEGDGFVVVGDDQVPTDLQGALGQVVAAEAVRSNAVAQGVDLGELNRGSQLQSRLLDPQADQSEARSVVAFAFAVVFLFTALTYGMAIAQSVTQEKESRVVEILAAAIPIRDLLWGKILGNTALALGQLLIVVTIGVVGLAATGRSDLLAGIGLAVVWYVAFFVLGFLALAALWSVAGSLASQQQDLQATTLPMQMILLIPYFAAVLGGDRVREVFSMVPIAATMVMPGRMAQGAVPWWQIGVAIGLTVLAAVVFVRVGSRIYQRTLLQTGGRIGFKQALRLGRS